MHTYIHVHAYIRVNKTSSAAFTKSTQRCKLFVIEYQLLMNASINHTLGVKTFSNMSFQIGQEEQKSGLEETE